MTEYTLHLTLDGDTRTLTITGDTPDQLAAEVHRHARGQSSTSICPNPKEKQHEPASARQAVRP